MKYNKPAVSFIDQITKLKARGLSINDEVSALRYVSNISFYRLRAYTYPFQDNTDSNHPFIKNISFEEIIGLYDFDRRLRLLVMDGIEKIEIALRTQIIYQWSMTKGSHWQLNQTNYRNPSAFVKHLGSLQKEIDRSSETFIEHYKSTYTNPSEPPSWMSLEVSSFGLLSLIFKNLRRGPEKKAVTDYFGFKKDEILENWIHCFSNVRNICAHHGRLWNRRLSNHLEMPRKTNHEFITNKQVLKYKIYAVLCAMQYISNIVNPNNSFKQKVNELMDSCPLSQEKEMGFPKDWRNEKFWKM